MNAGLKGGCDGTPQRNLRLTFEISRGQCSMTRAQERTRADAVRDVVCSKAAFRTDAPPRTTQDSSVWKLLAPVRSNLTTFRYDDDLSGMLRR